MQSKILIVGAGPTGLSAAVEFARRGIIVDIVERRSEPSMLSRAVGILPETIAKLDHCIIGMSFTSVEEQ
ncbi:FAD-dependent oxidoreductase [bacterium]|nr:FAD-dependent oxidoreductase [bacterium]